GRYTMLLLSVMLVLLAAAVNPAQGQVIKEIKEDSVILDCEVVGDATVKWFKDKTEDKEQTKTTFEAKAKQGVVEGVFTCEFSKTDTNPIKHTFYLKIKVCENCYELSGLTGWGIMFGDVLITGGVIIIIYFCAARNSDGPPKKGTENIRHDLRNQSTLRPFTQN
uniref:CD3 gamma/delta subunit Ig-like domain-containing protein n=1 Tax=Cyprinus carpio TaxID=7962 RepID=A0A8C2DXF9_CYPCA